MHNTHKFYILLSLALNDARGSKLGLCGGKFGDFMEERGFGKKREIRALRPDESHIHSHMNYSRKDSIVICKPNANKLGFQTNSYLLHS